MAMTDVSTLLPYISPYVPGCPDPVIRQKLSEAAREFVAATDSWRENATAITTVVGTHDYTVALDATFDATVLRLLRVYSGTVDYGESADYSPADYYLTNEQKLYFVDAPTSVFTVTVKASLLPDVGCATYPDWYVKRWGDGFINEALFLLKSDEGVPWSDPRGAAQYDIKRRGVRSRAITQNNTRGTSGILVARNADFF